MATHNFWATKLLSTLGMLTLATSFGWLTTVTTASAATIDAIKNTAKSNNLEAWEIDYSGKLNSKYSRAPKISVDAAKKQVTLTFYKDMVNSKLKPFRVSGSIINDIKYEKSGSYQKIIFTLDNSLTETPKLVSDRGSFRLILSYNSNNNVRPLIVAIDAGHGGKDPGTIGRTYGTKEKDVTLAIARYLYKNLHDDPNFNPILTRNGNYYIAVTKRPLIAQQKHADVLISIHADASLNRRAIGSSVWVLSNRRANTETGRLLESHEQLSNLLGGNSLAVTDSKNYIKRSIFDLGFDKKIQLSTNLAYNILGQIRGTTNLHFSKPQFASLGVLNSPRIPSILIETGFLSNSTEESRLRKSRYQKSIAQDIYDGLKQYRDQQALLYTVTDNIPVVMKSYTPVKAYKVASNVSVDNNAGTIIVGKKTYTIRRGDLGLITIAKNQDVSYQQLLAVNPELKNPNRIRVGQKIYIPILEDKPLPDIANNVNFNKTTKYTVVKGDSLYQIAVRNKITTADLQKANPQLSGTIIRPGDIITLPTAVQETDDGNTATVATLIDSGSTHTVKPGDTLIAIADLYNTAAEDIKDFNHLTSNIIHPGQVLKIPQVATVKASASQSKQDLPIFNDNLNTSDNTTSNGTPKTIAAPKLVDSGKTYKIAVGDTLSEIAVKFGVSSHDLMVFNNLPNKHDIRSGYTLKIPTVVNSAPSTDDAPANPRTGETYHGIALILYQVKPGDVISTIAEKYHMTVTEFKRANDLVRNTINAGEFVKVFDPNASRSATPSQPTKVVTPTPSSNSSNNNSSSKTSNSSTPSTLVSTSNATTNSANGNSSNGASSDSTVAGTPVAPVTPVIISYRVKPGESFNSIAYKFHMSEAELRQLNHITRRVAYRDEILKVYKEGTAPSQNSSNTTTNTSSNATSTSTTKVATSASTSTNSNRATSSSNSQVTNTASSNTIASKLSSRPLASYRVKAGESFTSIAQKFAMTVDELRTVNKLSRNTAYKGEVLQVFDPSAKSSASTTASSNSSVTSTSRKIGYYRARPGESFHSIASKYGMTETELKKLNNIKSRVLLVGQRLKVYTSK